MRRLLPTALLAAAAIARAEPSFPSEKLVAAPAGVAVAGAVVDGRRFHDKNGENVVLVTKERRKDGPALHVYHLARRGGGAFATLRQLNDLVKDCELDSFLDLIPGALTVTDLDRDGLGEVTLAYALSCRGDVSADDMKLMLLEDKAKLAMRGARVLMVRRKSGKLEPMDAASSSPPPAPDPALRRNEAFFAYAQDRWRAWHLQIVDGGD